MIKRHILVTGGNRGIGLAIVKAMGREQADRILLGCRDLEEGRKIASELGANIEAVQIDLSQRTGLAESLERVLEKYPSIDVLINNAGVLYQEGFENIEIEKVDQTLRINSVAPLELIRALIPGMRKNGYGRIVNISSGWGSFGEGLSGPFSYSISKALLNAITLGVARDLPIEIKINSMCPGWVRTRMGGMTASRSPEEGAETAVWLANLPPDGPSGEFFRDKKLIEW